MSGRALSIAVSVLSSILVLGACESEDDPPKIGNGVNDVRAACDLQAKWSRSDACNLCAAAVVAPRCECESLKAHSAECLDQAEARKKACPAGFDDQCLVKCQPTDCGCIEACYANEAECKRASAARDGCVAEACASECK